MLLARVSYVLSLDLHKHSLEKAKDKAETAEDWLQLAEYSIDVLQNKVEAEYCLDASIRQEQSPKDIIRIASFFRWRFLEEERCSAKLEELSSFFQHSVSVCWLSAQAQYALLDRYKKSQKNLSLGLELLQQEERKTQVTVFKEAVGVFAPQPAFVRYAMLLEEQLTQPEDLSELLEIWTSLELYDRVFPLHQRIQDLYLRHLIRLRSELLQSGVVLPMPEPTGFSENDWVRKKITDQKIYTLDDIKTYQKEVDEQRECHDRFLVINEILHKHQMSIESLSKPYLKTEIQNLEDRIKRDLGVEDLDQIFELDRNVDCSEDQEQSSFEDLNVQLSSLSSQSDTSQEFVEAEREVLYFGADEESSESDSKTSSPKEVVQLKNDRVEAIQKRQKLILVCMFVILLLILCSLI